jgi:hypothetical protein
LLVHPGRAIRPPDRHGGVVVVVVVAVVVAAEHASLQLARAIVQQHHGGHVDCRFVGCAPQRRWWKTWSGLEGDVWAVWILKFGKRDLQTSCSFLHHLPGPTVPSPHPWVADTWRRC